MRKEEYLKLKQADGSGIFASELAGYASKAAADVLAQNWEDCGLENIGNPSKIVQDDINETIGTILMWARAVNKDFKAPAQLGAFIAEGKGHLVAQRILRGKNYDQDAETLIYGASGELISVLHGHPTTIWK